MTPKILIALLFSVIAPSCFAQLIESVELNDYVDPNYRKHIAGDTVNFLNFVPAVGVVRNYQYNNEFSGRYANTMYLLSKADLYYYVGDLQFNAKTNYFTSYHDGQSNIFRAKAQVCYYLNGITLVNYGDKEYSPPIRLQLTYNYNNVRGLQDHQLFFDYGINIVKPEVGFSFLSSNVVLGWTLNRREFLYGVSAKGSFFIRGNVAQVLKHIGYGYSIIRSKVDGNDRWGNFKVQIFSILGPRYLRFSSLLSASYTREIYYRFNNWEFGLILRNPFTQGIIRSGKRGHSHFKEYK